MPKTKKLGSSKILITALYIQLKITVNVFNSYFGWINPLSLHVCWKNSVSQSVWEIHSQNKSGYMQVKANTTRGAQLSHPNTYTKTKNDRYSLRSYTRNPLGVRAHCTTLHCKETKGRGWGWEGGGSLLLTASPVSGPLRAATGVLRRRIVSHEQGGGGA